MSEQLNASTTREEESNFQFHIRLGSIDNCIEIPADGEWHSIIYYDGDITFDSIEVHNRALSEDEIRDAFSGDFPVFGNYADRVLSKEEVESIFRLLNDHPEIKSWQIRNNILYLEVDEGE